MNRRLLLALFLLVFPAIAFAQTQRYIVTTHHAFDMAVRALPREDFDPAPRAAMRIRRFQVIDGFAADLTADQVRRLASSNEVDVIEPVVERHALVDSVTPGQQTTPYGVKMVHAPDVWPVTKGQGVNGFGPIHVAIIDTGIDYNAPELSAIYKGGFNFVNGTTDPLDDAGHGTHVSGIIAAADNTEGVVGVAPAIDLYVLKVLDHCGSGSSEDVIAAVDWIVQKKGSIGGDWVVNLSLGSPDPSTSEQAAFQRGVDAGILFFASAGNSYDTNPVDGLAFPAGYPMVESVGAIDSNQQIATFSQRGPGLKLVAPGVAVLSTFVDVQEMDAISGPITIDAVRVDAFTNTRQLTCTAAPTVTGALFNAGSGNTSDFSNSTGTASGKIALIQRAGTSNATGSTLTFSEKAKNAKAAGAVGVIIYNNRATENAADPPGWGMTGLSGANDVPPVVVGVTQAEGQQLVSHAGSNATIAFGHNLSNEGYALEDGTSMSSPHAAAVAALVWAVAPTATANEVAQAIENTATDLGDAGVDNVYGHGLVNALAAATRLNPSAFGQAPQPKTGRVPGRRGGH